MELNELKMNEKNNSSKEDSILIKSAKSAASKAVRSSLALGLTVRFIKNNTILEISSKGKSILKEKKINDSIDISKYKKGMILERK